jgi:hypothetical protein
MVWNTWEDGATMTCVTHNEIRWVIISFSYICVMLLNIRTVGVERDNFKRFMISNISTCLEIELQMRESTSHEFNLNVSHAKRENYRWRIPPSEYNGNIRSVRKYFSVFDLASGFRWIPMHESNWKQLSPRLMCIIISIECHLVWKMRQAV